GRDDSHAGGGDVAELGLVLRLENRLGRPEAQAVESGDDDAESARGKNLGLESLGLGAGRLEFGGWSRRRRGSQEALAGSRDLSDRRGKREGRTRVERE